MIRPMLAEWIKLMRRGVWLGGLGSAIGIVLLITILLFATSKDTPNLSPETCERDPNVPLTPQERAELENASRTGQRRGPNGPPFCVLERSDGMLRTYGFATTILGIVAVVLAAQGMGTEYSQGTLKVALTREPRRVRFLLGKVIALAAFLAIVVVLAAVAASAAAFAMAALRGIDTSAWTSTAALAEAAGLVARTWTACVTWATIGFLLAVLMRSAAPALGVGIGYIILGEPIVGLIIGEAAKWLPGNMMSAWVNLGDAEFAAFPLTATTAGAGVAAYATVFLVIACFAFWRRDVT